MMQQNEFFLTEVYLKILKIKLNSQWNCGWYSDEEIVLLLNDSLFWLLDLVVDIQMVLHAKDWIVKKLGEITEFTGFFFFKVHK